VDSLADGLRSIRDVKLGAGFLFESLLYWGCNALGVWLLAVGCGLPLGFGHAMAVMGVLAIGILLPAGPGLFGNFQLAVTAILRLYLAEAVVETRGAVFVFLLYVLQSRARTATSPATTTRQSRRSTASNKRTCRSIADQGRPNLCLYSA
jgi:hypothetical protein